MMKFQIERWVPDVHPSNANVKEFSCSISELTLEFTRANSRSSNWSAKHSLLGGSYPALSSLTKLMKNGCSTIRNDISHAMKNFTKALLILMILLSGISVES